MQNVFGINLITSHETKDLPLAITISLLGKHICIYEVLVNQSTCLNLVLINFFRKPANFYILLRL